MRTTSGVICALLLLVVSETACAQKVLYSPFIGTQSSVRFEVVGKSGNYYWVQKSKTKFRSRKPAEPWLDDKEVVFDIYDARMILLKTIPSLISPSLVKEYLVPGDKYFDQLVLQPAHQKTIAVLKRYTPDGEIAAPEDTIAEFPGGMKCGDFLLIRSQDKSKILLLGFETIADAPPQLHAMVFDHNWQLMCRSSYNDVHISKPLVQYEQVDYPLEDYNSAAIKIGNNGQWVMITSGLNHNYLLFQFKGIEEGFAYKQIKLPANLTVEDAGLYLDNEKQQGFAGILSRVRNPGIKNVRVINYSIDSFRINFDTSYLLNTLAKNKIRNENIFEEYFMLVPGKGFLFLKEYGQSFPADEDAERFNDTGQDADDTKNSGETGAPLLFNRDEYTRYDNLAGTRSNFERGDLTLYYFPATKSDSCWSGIINKEQVTELGTSYLSYVFLPREDKLFFLYNSFYRNRDQYSSTTVLDQKGNAMNEGIEYWKINNTLVFQKARQISENELAIPYERNMRNGFAIIHL